jgi:hypothetical protein
MDITVASITKEYRMPSTSVQKVMFSVSHGNMDELTRVVSCKVN